MTVSPMAIRRGMFESGTWVSQQYFDLPRFVEGEGPGGEALRGLVDNPRVLPLVQAAMGGKVVVDQIQGRTVPTDTTGQLGGYTSWHRDGVGPTGLVATHPANALTIKAFTFPFDVAEDQGPAAVVPGSHRVQGSVADWAPTRSFSGGGGATKNGGGADAQDTMPGHIAFAPCPAGTCVFYDNSIMHTSLPNTSGSDRCALITSYKPNGGCGEVNSRGVSGQVFANAERLSRRGLLEGRPELAQLLGAVEDYHTPGWHVKNLTPDNM